MYIAAQTGHCAIPTGVALMIALLAPEPRATAGCAEVRHGRYCFAASDARYRNVYLSHRMMYTSRGIPACKIITRFQVDNHPAALEIQVPPNITTTQNSF